MVQESNSIDKIVEEIVDEVVKRYGSHVKGKGEPYTDYGTFRDGIVNKFRTALQAIIEERKQKYISNQ